MGGDILEATEIRLLRRPTRSATAADFAAHRVVACEPGEGEVLIAVRWLSIDPYLNERVMGDAAGPAVAPGACMVGRGIGIVVKGALPAGTAVLAETGWRTHATVAAASVTRLPADERVPATWWLGALGVPGLTAWIALDLLRPDRAGGTLLVTSAAGTVGSTALQLARAAGLRTVGIAGGRAKCEWLEELGAIAVDRRDAHFADRLREALSDTAGFDMLLDNAGGSQLQAALAHARIGARVVLCGHVASYHGERAAIDADLVLLRRLMLRGLLVHEHAARFDEARAALLDLARRGGLQARETVHEGLHNAAPALQALLQGAGVGKHLVRVS